MVTDPSGNYSAIWRPYHYVGLELAQSIYSVALDNKATGFTKNYNADVAAIAKKDLKIGDKLDGEGGFCARGRLITSQKSKKDRKIIMAFQRRFLPNEVNGKITDKTLKISQLLA